MKEKIEKSKNQSFILNQKGITLVVLIVTIIVMLILATITIGAINGGLLEHAGEAKAEAEETSDRAGIEKAYLLAKGEKNLGDITLEEMQEALNQVFGENVIKIMENGETFVAKHGDIYYVVNKKGKVEEGRKIEQIENAGQITRKGTGTEENPYKIECIEDLVGLSRMVNTSTSSNGGRLTGKYIVLTKDLDFNSIFSYANYQAKYKYDSSSNAYVTDSTSETTIKELCTTGYGFIPITNIGSSEEQSFQGIFDGQNYTISNLYINGTNNTSTKGLFGKIRNATIKNLTVDGLVKGQATGGSGVAAIVGSSSGTSYITNCVNKATIEATLCPAAGIISTGGANVTGCINEGTIKEISSESSEGVAFGIGRCNANKCINKGKVTGTGKLKLFGISNSTPKNCYNTSDIGDDNTGAAAGISWSNAKNCCNYGNLTANPKRISQYAGPAGISGCGANGELVYNCCSLGVLKLIGTKGVYDRSAIISKQNSVVIKNCFYLNGVPGTTGITPETNTTMFYKTSDDPEAMTTAKVVAALNNFIELKGVLQEGDTEVNTTGWCKWVVGDNNLPALDFETEWNGTTWVTVSN